MPNYQGVWSLSTQFQNRDGWPVYVPPVIALFAGGDPYGSNNTIQEVDITTAGNSTDFGD